MNRLKQGSTWAGLSGFALALAAFFPEYREVIAIVAGAFGGAAAAINDKQKPYGF